MRPLPTLIILFILQAITTIATWYSISFLHAYEVNPITSYLISALPRPWEYVIGYIIAVAAYVLAILL